MCVMVANWGSPRWRFLKKKKSWRFEERCTAVLFGAVFVMVVNAPDCKKDLDVHETFIVYVTKILWEGRPAGAKDLYITGDLNVELGVMCTDEHDNDELNEIHGPKHGASGLLCWALKDIG